MKLYLVEFLVRLGVAVIADGTIKPRWYGSDQSKMCKRQQDYWWSCGNKPRFLFDVMYYEARRRVTGSTRQTHIYFGCAS